MSLAKHWTAPEQNQCAHRDPPTGAHRVYKVSALYSGTGSVPEFQRGHLKRRCVYISGREYRFRKSVKYSVTRHNRVRKKYHERFHHHSELSFPGTCFSKVLAYIAQTLENAMHQINHYPADKF